MIWHQAVTPNQDVELSTPLGHQDQVCVVVFIAEKSFHPPISTLGHVVRNTGGDYAGNSGHWAILMPGKGNVEGEIGMVSPLFPWTK